MEGEVKSGGHEDKSLQAEVTDTKAWRWGGKERGAALLDLSGDRENRTARSMAECGHTQRLHSGLQTVWPHDVTLRLRIREGLAD